MGGCSACISGLAHLHVPEYSKRWSVRNCVLPPACLNSLCVIRNQPHACLNSFMCHKELGSKTPANSLKAIPKAPYFTVRISHLISHLGGGRFPPIYGVLPFLCTGGRNGRRNIDILNGHFRPFWAYPVAQQVPLGVLL